VRHPFYLAFALAALANGLTTANWFILAVGIAAWILIVIRTPTEEARLIARFGAEYRDYANRTGRFFPRLFHREARHV
jgi:protein-S-isoprenylcysteine O-methyltransferase Ste14